MAVDAKAAEEMARLMNIMNGTTPSMPSSPPSQHGDRPVAPTEADAMKVILERFHRATDSAVRSPDIATSRELRNAMMTERTKQGVRIGAWEIRVNAVNEKLKTYGVFNVNSNTEIARELWLYEAAHALTKLLNNGVTINTPAVREILALEEAFAKHRNDAVSFKKKLQRTQALNESFKADVALARYKESRAQALRVRNRVREINEALR